MKTQKRSALNVLRINGNSKHFEGMGLKRKSQIITTSYLDVRKEYNLRQEANERKLFEEAIDKEFLYLELFDR